MPARGGHGRSGRGHSRKAKVQKGHGQKAKKMGKGQVPKIPRVTASVAYVPTNSCQITFDMPCVVAGNIDLDVDGDVNLLSQQVQSQTQVTQTYDDDISGMFWTIIADQPAIRNFQGGGVYSKSGSF